MLSNKTPPRSTNPIKHQLNRPGGYYEKASGKPGCVNPKVVVDLIIQEPSEESSLTTYLEHLLHYSLTTYLEHPPGLANITKMAEVS